MIIRDSTGSFEISIHEAQNPEKSTQIWSGVNKGPPRKDKFPESSALVDSINAFMKSH